MIRYRVTRHALAVGSNVFVKGDEFEADASTLPEWSALHGAIASGMVVACDSGSPLGVDDESAPNDGLDEMSRSELYRAACDRGLDVGWVGWSADRLRSAIRGQS